MSFGTRVPLHRASAAARLLIEIWQLPANSIVVGSIRRRRPDVGDIELLCPAMEGKRDEVYEKIAPTCMAEDGALFAAGTPAKPPFAEAIEGLKPGFKLARLRVQLSFNAGEEALVLPVEVHRATNLNRGWKMIQTTGPREFGIFFLQQWKRVQQTPEGKEASVEGHLVDQWGKVIPVDTEDQAFNLARLEYVPPEARDDFIHKIDAERSRDLRSVMR